MIIRILTEGQWRFPAGMLDDLNDIDNSIVDVLAEDDEGEFRASPKQNDYDGQGQRHSP